MIAVHLSNPCKILYQLCGVIIQRERATCTCSIWSYQKEFHVKVVFIHALDTEHAEVLDISYIRVYVLFQALYFDSQRCVMLMVFITTVIPGFKWTHSCSQKNTLN